ncbi:hypothetical protein ACFYW8_02500 [Streptomyces sp. NPDC002742]|uniref:hypothetical protein n=1 Tax=Streptomyces sp. NPDC002742 TaxID=3364663 RepID=UPI0036AAA372
MSADVDVEGWESGHQVAYGCGAWERACHQARLLVAWHEECDRGFGAPVPRRFYADPGPRVKWPWGAARHTTVGLLLWRTAFEAGVLVDEVVLADALRHCVQGADALDAGPLPDGAHGAGIGVGSAASVAGIGHVLRAHAEADPPRARPSGVRLTLGYRVRELRATPDWELGDWPAALALARQAMGRADDLREQGTWQPTDQERSVAARICRDLEPPPGTSGALGRPATSWLERASRLAETAAVLSSTADALPRDARGSAGPLAQVLGGTADACARLAVSTEEIGRLWAAEPHEPADPASWEPSHVPGALVTQTEETEHLVRAVAVFSWVLVCS